MQQTALEHYKPPSLKLIKALSDKGTLIIVTVGVNTLGLLISVPERGPVFGPYAGRHGRQLACQWPTSKIRHGY